MKKVLSIIALGLSLVVLSCQKESGAINEITDHYTAPAGAVEMTGLSAKSTWATDRRYFELTFGGDLSTTLVGYDALLAPGQYVLGDDVIGNAILSKTKVSGAAAQGGYVMVLKNGGEYMIDAEIDGKSLVWKGTLPFTADPAPTALTEVLSAQSNLANGSNSLTMNLAQAGLSQEFDWTTFQNVWKGEGIYLALDIYSEDGYLHDGVYMPCAEGGKVNAGEFGIGYDGVFESDWGQYPFENWGTCVWTVAGGVATAEKVTGGMVKVSSQEVDEEVIWTITWGQKYAEEVRFVGAIPALTTPKKPSGGGSVTPTYLYTETVEAGEGVDKHCVTITDKDGNERAYLEFLLATGETDLSGSYPSTSYASQPGQLCDGWEFDGTAFGMGFMEGGSYYIDDSGNKVRLTAGAYTVDVTPIATGAYRFVCSIFDLAAAGPDYVPGDGGGDGGDDLPVYSMEDTVAQDCTLNDGQTLVTDVESHTLVLKDGETFVAQIKLIRSVGATDLAGEYTVKEYAHEDFAAGNGFDLGAMFGMDPGAWVIGSYYMKDGALVIIEPDETITVTSAGANAWKFVGSTGYAFVGQL